VSEPETTAEPQSGLFPAPDAGPAAGLAADPAPGDAPGPGTASGPGTAPGPATASGPGPRGGAGARNGAKARRGAKGRGAGDPEDAEDAGLPDLTDDREFEGALESVLLVVDSPIDEKQLAGVLEQPVRRVTRALRALAARYTESGSGVDLRRIGDGWRFYTRDRFAPFVEKLLLDGQRAKLTRAALETLAVIAYRQPVTRARVAAVRGVNVDGVIRTLVARGLIAEAGADPDTGGILYRTTELFLERLGLSSLDDLPPIAPLLPEVDAIDDV